ncbi:hypothetical protein JCM14202_1663 [Agrilactobacillus composti DSM 18527 = JCM 14202]|jgi:hypothetical protein|nr:hypothetical protein [Agrilactobacillus composti]MCH4170809.1 hypothetical protein [Lactobacillus sp.]GAF39787.1 hypothetical protein JCM14202_1663 [Agrilactobacillus composti DSM 18527 = JCM 14202]
MDKTVVLSDQEISTLNFILSEYRLQHSGSTSLGLADISEFKKLENAKKDLPVLFEKLN